MDRLDQFNGFCATPSIFGQDSDFQYSSFDFPEIIDSPELLEDLENISHPRNSVLGKRMESFFELAIKHSKRYELLASNIQVIDHGRTLGELDFLVRDRQLEKVVHVELVYKLYIFDPEMPEMGWIGPNRRDSFLKKLNRLERHQFPLLYHPATKPYLDKLGLEAGEIDQQVCFKAKLFRSGTNFDHPGVNRECFTGNWISLQDFNQKRDDSLYYSPKKQDWSCLPRNNRRWFPHSNIKEQVLDLCKKERSPLLWQKSGLGYDCFFVVWW